MAKKSKAGVDSWDQLGFFENPEKYVVNNKLWAKITEGGGWMRQATSDMFLEGPPWNERWSTGFIAVFLQNNSLIYR